MSVYWPTLKTGLSGSIRWAYQTPACAPVRGSLVVGVSGIGYRLLVGVGAVRAAVARAARTRGSEGGRVRTAGAPSTP